VSTLTPPIHFRRGEDPEASPKTAAARRAQLAIERRHRMERRAGRSPSTTPSLQTLREGPIPNTPCHREVGFATASPFATPPEHPPSHPHDSQPFISSFGIQFDSSYHDSPRPGRPRRHGSLRPFSGSRSSSLAPHLQPDDSRSFYCERCTVNRPWRVLCIQTDCTDLVDYHCKYCHPDNINDPATHNTDEENGDAIWCTTGNHEASRCQFIDDNGRTYSSCLHCRRSIDLGVRMGVNRAMQDDGDDITPSQAIRDARRSTLQDSDPPMDPTDPATLSNPALSERDWQFVKDFQRDLDRDNLETCNCCHERWFGMCLVNNVCAQCRRLDRGLQVDEPRFFSAENQLDPGDVPDLPQLTEVEQMLIARVHTFVEVRRVRGPQHRYTGHVISFERDVGSIYDELPLLPSEVNILFIRPQNSGSHDGLRKQFAKDFRVRRSRIEQWLNWLKEHHPGYRDITINRSNIQQLPLNGIPGHLGVDYIGLSWISRINGMLKLIMDNMLSILVSWITCYPGYSVTWAFIDCLRSSRGKSCSRYRLHEATASSSG
jgi:hypothetical protein